MAEKIEMPQLSDTMEAGKIVEWFVDEGDPVERGDVLAEVETDKATMDLEAFGDGVLLKKCVEEGEEVPTQSTIAVIGEEGEDISGLLEEDGEAEVDQSTAEEKAPEEEEPGVEPRQEEKPEASQEDGEPVGETEAEPTPSEPKSPEPTETEPIRTPETEATDGRLRASPLARRIAAREGLDLSKIRGSGTEGRIVKKDVQQALQEGQASMAPVRQVEGGQPSPLQEEEKPLSGMRRTIAERMSQSKQNVPHFYLEQNCNMDQLTKLVESLREDGREIALNDFILMGASRALCEVPRMNASYQEDSVKLFGQVDLGFAVAVEDGLFTPVIREAETKSVDRIHQESQELITKAREGNIKPDEYRGGTFTVSNLGMFDVPNFSAVINPPEAGILAVGKAEERPVADDGAVKIQKQMSMTLACDHRAVDGAIGARYLKALKSLLENPARMYT